MKEIGRCEKHRMVIYEKHDGAIWNTCGVCSPPPEPGVERKRLNSYKTTNTDRFCSEETLEMLQELIPSKLTFQVPPWAEDAFFNDFLDCTGVQAEFDTPGIYRNNAKNMADKRWYSACIEFEWDDDMVFSSEYAARIKPAKKDGWVLIHCIHMTGWLLSNGLSAGPNNQ